MEAGRNIHTPFNQACAADMFDDHAVLNFVGSFTLTVPEHSTAFLYSGFGSVTIVNEDGEMTFILNGKLCFPIKIFQGDSLSIVTNENTLTQLLLIDAY